MSLQGRLPAPATQAHPPFGTPSQLASSFSTVQESAAAGPTEPVQAPKLLLELSAAATHSC